MEEKKGKGLLSVLHYNSPVVLTYAIICVITLAVSYFTGGWFNTYVMASYGHPDFSDPMTYVRCFTHVLGHADWDHLFNNMILMMLVGPAVEERYGSRNLIIMIVTTAVVTAAINWLFFSTGIIGASGVVFMMIILSAFTNMQKGRIPITLIIVSVMYLGREIYNALQPDQISQMAHIVGGVIGLMYGIIFYKKKFSGRY